MAFLIKYARLFEVRILHGYYLDKGDEKSFFGLDDSDPDDFDFKKAIMKRYDLLTSDLIIEPTEECRTLLKHNRMVFRTLPTGFLIGLEVEERIQGGETLHLPVTELETGTVLQFKIKLSNKNWSDFSSFRLRPNVPAKYYFSNFQDIDSVAPPSLSLTSEPLKSRFYEMGEMVYEEGTGQLFEAITGVPSGTPLNSSSHWRQISDLRYINYRDQYLLPSRFAYAFTTDPGQQITEATFILSTLDETEVARIETSGSGPFKDFFLNFRRLEVPFGKYLLHVTGSNGYQDEKQILINDDLFETDLLGIISIGHQTGLPNGLKLLEDDGSLRRINGETRHPEFELRIKPRATYWRYIPHPRQIDVFNPPGDADVTADPDNGNRLITRTPLPLTRLGSEVRFDDNTFLPNPSNFRVVMEPEDAGRRHFSDVYLDKG